MTRSAQRAAWIAGGLAAIAILVLLLARPWRGEPAPDADRAAERPSPAMEGKEGMTGMPGMEMGDEGSIQLTDAQLRTFGVTFGTAELRSVERSIRAVGVVAFDETGMAVVSPKIGGWVERLYVNFTGQPVSRGRPLLEIYSPDLVSAQEELLLARRLDARVGASGVEGVARGSRELLASARRRLRNWDVTEAQIETVLRTGRVQRTLTLHAPVSGTVIEKNVLEGQAVRAGDALYTIADLTRVWVEAELFEADAALIHEGMAATVEVAGAQGRPLGGRVEYVYPVFDEETRSMKARIALPNPGGRLKPGMYATVRLERHLGEVLTLPRSAVLQTGDGAVAFVDMGGGRLMPHALTLGIEGEEYVEVVGGVEPGQRVVTSAQYLLDSESNLAEVMRAMMSQMNPSDVQEMDGMEGMEGMEDMD